MVTFNNHPYISSSKFSANWSATATYVGMVAECGHVMECISLGPKRSGSGVNGGAGLTGEEEESAWYSLHVHVQTAEPGIPPPPCYSWS